MPTLTNRTMASQPTTTAADDNPNVHELVRVLKERQRAEGESDVRFAQRLGISRATWGQLKNGTHQPYVLLLSGTLAVYPDLEPLVLQYLRDVGSTNNARLPRWN